MAMQTSLQTNLGGGEPLSKVELSFECQKLVNLDTTSKSDPQVWVYVQHSNAKWTFEGKTEVIDDNLNPKFAKTIPLDYYFEKVQQLKFVVVDVDGPSNKIEDHDLIGECLIHLGDICSATQVTRKLVNPKFKSPGFIVITSTEIGDQSMECEINVNAQHLDKKDLFGKSDPFLEIYTLKGNNWLLVHRTEHILKTLHPTWKPFAIMVAKMDGGNAQAPLKIQVHDWNKSGKSDFIGEFQTSREDLVHRAGQPIPLINPKYSSKKSYKNSGTVTFSKFNVVKKDSFLNYIAGGCQINLSVAIDYTGSNGDPKLSTSLHYQNPFGLNDYQRAMVSVGQILLQYDSDGQVPFLGFGAKFLHNDQVSHCFAINGREDNPNVVGIPGLMDAYKNSFNGVKLYGPTHFASIIKTVAAEAAQIHKTVQDVQAYQVLLIITDGEINDMDATCEQIVNATDLPLSIVIVGVGPADFSKMERLDGDEQKLTAGNKVAKRDIVQFVAFRDYTSDTSNLKLAADTLKEIPDQFMEYMKANNVKPHPPPTPEQIFALQQKQMAEWQAQMATHMATNAQATQQQPAVGAYPGHPGYVQQPTGQAPPQAMHTSSGY